jgi:hypothetical protein
MVNLRGENISRRDAEPQRGEQRIFRPEAQRPREETSEPSAPLRLWANYFLPSAALRELFFFRYVRANTCSPEEGKTATVARSGSVG